MKNKLVLVVNSKSNALNQREEYIKHFKEKFSLTIICPNAESLKTEPKLKGISLQNLPLSRSGKSIFTELNTMKHLYRVLKSEGPQTIFHAYTIKPIFYLALLNTFFFRGKLKTYFTFTGLGYLFIEENSNKILRLVICKLLKLCFRGVQDRIIFQNPDDKLHFIKLGITNEKSHVVLGSGVDTDQFDFHPKEKSIPLKFLFIGRLLTDKGLLELLKAFSNFLKTSPSCAELIIAGDADHENPNAMDNSLFNSFLGEKIKYIGYQKDIKSAIIKSDVVVLPSYREGVPLSLIQACSIGRPIVASDAPGCKETVVDKKNGYKVEIGSVSSIESALKFMMEKTDEQWLSLGHESRKLATTVFSSTVINKKIEDIYRLT